ncbi:MAG: hypothetical protein SGBAC_000472 [Bacillariaceae sp.]
MNKNDNPYDILGVAPGATEAEVKKAYRQLARTFHPDKQKTDEEREAASGQFARVSDAYDLLQDPVRRYDWRMKNETSQPRSSSTSTSTARTSTTQSTTSQIKTKAKTTTATTKAHTPSYTPRRVSAVPIRTSRSSFASPQSVRSSHAPSQSSPVGRRPKSLGPGRRVSVSPHPTFNRSSTASASTASAAAAVTASVRRASSPSATSAARRASSLGPGQGRQRSVANDIPRRSMAGPSPIRTKSPRPSAGRKNTSNGVRKPKKRESVDSMESKKMRRPKSSASLASDARSVHSVSSSRVPKKPASRGSLDAASEHSRRIPRRYPANSGLDAGSVHSVSQSKMRRPTSRDSVSSMASGMRRPSSRESLRSLKSVKSEPGLRKKAPGKKKKGILNGGFSLRGSTADMRNATFDSTSGSKSVASRRRLL